MMCICIVYTCIYDASMHDVCILYVGDCHGGCVAVRAYLWESVLSNHLAGQAWQEVSLPAEPSRDSIHYVFILTLPKPAKTIWPKQKHFQE